MNRLPRDGYIASMGAIRRLRDYFARYWVPYAAGLLCLLGSNLCATLVPRFIQRGIDGVIAHAPTLVRSASLTLLAVATVGALLRFGMRYLINGASRRVETDLRRDFFSHLMRLGATFHQRHPVGDLMARATNDVMALRMVAGPAVMYLVDTTVRTVMIVPAMASLSPSLTVWALLPTLGLPVAMVFLGGEVHRRSLAVQEQFGDISSFAQEHFGGVRVVRAYVQEAAETSVFHGLDAGYVDRNMRLARAQGVFNPLLGTLGGIGALIALTFGGRLAIEGRLSTGAFVAFGVYLATLVWPMIALGWAISLVQRGDAATSRLDVLFATQPEIRDPMTPVALPPAAGPRRVTFDSVWFRYPTDEERGWVLRDVSFEIAPGMVLGVVGETGSGKSTLAELLMRTWEPQRGRILVDGVDIRDLALESLRSAIALVPQETFLFSATLRDNVLLGAPDDGRLATAAATARLDAALPDLPAGWDTMLGERGINLSGGQRQRAAIARALVRDPSILILDDALSAVDAQTESEILRAMANAMTGRTCFIATHRFSALRDADNIIVLDDGQIVEAGTHRDLLARNGAYAGLHATEQLEASLNATD